MRLQRSFYIFIFSGNMTRWQRCISFFAKRKAKANLRSYCQDTPSKNDELFPFSLGSISSLGCVMHPRFSSFHSGKIRSTSKHPRLESEPTFPPKIWRYTVFLEKNEQFLNKGEFSFPRDVAEALKVAKVPKCISRGFVRHRRFICHTVNRKIYPRNKFLWLLDCSIAFRNRHKTLNCLWPLLCPIKPSDKKLSTNIFVNQVWKRFDWLHLIVCSLMKCFFFCTCLKIIIFGK